MAKVLVIDDSPMVRAVLLDYLDRLGHQSLAAASATEALSICTASQPDLVIKDLYMADTDPTELMQDLRRCRANLPIVVCSTSGQKHEIFVAIQNGANDFLLKPFALQDVATLIERYVG